MYTEDVLSWSNTETCFFCNGYYGPCFNQPICPTCHDFIFPDEPSSLKIGVPHFTEDKSDDTDSGNDEPNDGAYPPHLRVAPAPGRPVEGNREDEEGLDPLQERVKMLCEATEPLEYNSSVVIDNLPPEVLLVVFTYLDDMSLWSVANVCRRWQRLVESQVSQAKWKQYMFYRFPLFKPLIATENWFKIYSNFMEASSCHTCLENMRRTDLPICEENQWRRNRLQGEARLVTTEPPEGLLVLPLDIKYFRWQATINGPIGSPYEGGIFYVYLQIPYGYPITPPIVRFITKIFHPNISRHGDVGIDSIQHNWSLVLTISKVLLSIQSLLTDPYCEVCMEPQIGQLYLKDRETFNNIARAWTWKYAMQDVFI